MYQWNLQHAVTACSLTRSDSDFNCMSEDEKKWLQTS